MEGDWSNMLDLEGSLRWLNPNVMENLFLSGTTPLRRTESHDCTILT